MSYKRDDVETHSEHGRSHPAINVKARNLFGSYALREAWAAQGADEATIEKALEWCWEMHAENFWEQAQSDAEDVFGASVKVYSQGRSGGWLIVHGLSNMDDWDAISLGHWRKFETWCKGNVKYLTSDEAIREMVECNDWLGFEAAKDAAKGAEAFAAYASGEI